jgi:hypothetical protein
VQYVRRIRDTFFFNPGSVGLAYNHDQPTDRFHVNHWAEYAIVTVDQERISLEFRRIPFDVHSLITAYRESGRPYAEEAIAQYRKVQGQI